MPPSSTISHLTRGACWTLILQGGVRANAITRLDPTLAALPWPAGYSRAQYLAYVPIAHRGALVTPPSSSTAWACPGVRDPPTISVPLTAFLHLTGLAMIRLERARPLAKSPAQQKRLSRLCTTTTTLRSAPRALCLYPVHPTTPGHLHSIAGSLHDLAAVLPFSCLVDAIPCKLSGECRMSPTASRNVARPSPPPPMTRPARPPLSRASSGSPRRWVPKNNDER